MKKGFGFYFCVWLLLLAVFNVICFVTPTEAAGMKKFGGAFWAGYIFITIAFLGQLACAFKAFKSENAKKLFYNLPLITVSYTGLILTIIVGALCMAIPGLPNWVGIIICLLVLAFTAIAVIKASAAVEIVSGIDTKVATQTAFIKSLMIEAQSLASAAKTVEIRAEANKVFDAIRYSDPMSNSVLSDIENQIKNHFAAFKNAVDGNDDELAKRTAEELLSTIEKRNTLCKQYK